MDNIMDFLGWEAWLADFSFFQEYLEVMERLLESERQKRLESAKERKEHWEQEAGWYDVQMVEFCAPILRESLFVSLYAFLESRLNEACRLKRDDLNRNRQEEDRILLTLSDISDRGIQRASKYWKKVLHLRFPGNQEWSLINNYRRARNCIVHNEGKVDDRLGKDRERLEYFVNGNENLSLSGGRLNLLEGFCKEVLETTNAFFDRLGAEYLAE